MLLGGSQDSLLSKCLQFGMISGISQNCVKISWWIYPVKDLPQHTRSNINKKVTEPCIIGGLFGRRMQWGGRSHEIKSSVKKCL